MIINLKSQFGATGVADAGIAVRVRPSTALRGHLTVTPGSAPKSMAGEESLG